MTRSPILLRRALQACAFALCATFSALVPAQQDWPTKPVTLGELATLPQTQQSRDAVVRFAK